MLLSEPCLRGFAPAAMEFLDMQDGGSPAHTLSTSTSNFHDKIRGNSTACLALFSRCCSCP
jgi:hypothetical protein